MTRREVAEAGGADVERLAAARDRAAALEAMGRGAGEIAHRLQAEGRLDGIAGLGGTGGTSVATAAMRALPLGTPKLIVSAVAPRDLRPYVGGTDMTLMYAVTDIAGINRVSARILSNAAAADRGHGRVANDRLSTRRDRSSARRCSGSRCPASMRRGSGWKTSATRSSSSTRPAPADVRWRS